MRKDNYTYENAPLILFIYNRLDVLKKTVNSLANNYDIEKTDLYIFSDGAKIDSHEDRIKVEEVRNYINNIKKFTKTISYIEHKSNIGLKNSVIYGVSEVSKNHKNFIVLEDDLLTSKYFIRYMNSSLINYEEVKKVWSINGMGMNINVLDIPSSYNFNTYFTYRSSSHGWGSWTNRWNKVTWENEETKKEIFKLKNHSNFILGGQDLEDILIQQFNNGNDSWWIKWQYTISKNKAVCLAPINSHVSAQVDSNGTHIRVYMKNIDNDLSLSEENWTYPNKIEVDSNIAENLSLIYSANNKIQKLLRNKFRIFYSLFMFQRFIFKFIQYKLSIKSKVHRFKGFIKYHFGKLKNNFN